MIERKGYLYIISSPSGVGKSTLIKKAVEVVPNLQLTVSATTREKRPLEKEGMDYYFKTKDEFYKLIGEHAFLEYAEVYGNLYGTPKAEVENKLDKGIDLITDVDFQGMQIIKNILKEDVKTIFLLPPSMKELERRLLSRNQDSADIINLRIAKAKDEILKCSQYDYVIINDNIEKAVKDIASIINANTKEVKRISNLEKIIANI